MSEELSLREIQNEWHGSYRSYLIGFVASLILTLLAFSLAAANLLSRQVTIPLLVILAITQATLQLRYFLHLGEEPKPQWESLVFFFMVSTLLIIALGTLWIMYDLNERVMIMDMEGSHD